MRLAHFLAALLAFDDHATPPQRGQARNRGSAWTTRQWVRLNLRS